jgi:parallel beta-helix repeat protein
MLSLKQTLLSFTVFCAPVAFAATQCVNPGGNAGCKASINAAIAAAGNNDTVNVARGVYAEDVIVNKPIALIGEGAENTVIDATGLANGINVDGHGNAGLGNVVISGFTVSNANFQGILVTNASDVVILDNHVTGNDRSLQPFAAGGPVCPGLPAYFQAGEGFDCGEGIHLSAVTHSTVAGNVVDHNAGGILVSDDTGPNHDNFITRNTVEDNPYDCGITLASHHFGLSPQDPTLGVYRITVKGNTSRRNGLETGEGAGIGIFTGPPGAQNWGDVVVDNVATGNALPGVALHTHTVFQRNTDHLIANNTISGNGPDPDPGTTVPTGIAIFSDTEAGAAPATGIVITGNTIRGEGIDIAVKTPAEVDAHLNRLFDSVGIANLGAGSVDATMNWWKCSGGPQASGCSTYTGSGVTYAPWLTKPFNLNGDD